MWLVSAAYMHVCIYIYIYIHIGSTNSLTHRTSLRTWGSWGIFEPRCPRRLLSKERRGDEEEMRRWGEEGTSIINSSSKDRVFTVVGATRKHHFNPSIYLTIYPSIHSFNQYSPIHRPIDLPPIHPSYYPTNHPITHSPLGCWRTCSHRAWTPTRSSPGGSPSRTHSSPALAADGSTQKRDG